MNLKKVIAGTLAVALLASNTSSVIASSHREAPMVSGDPKVDGTDVYAFVSPDKQDTVTLIANYLPFEEPAGGPNFYQFDDNALYEIKVDSNGDAIEDISYQFRFKTTTKNPNTFLYNTGPITSLNDPDWNITQSYTLTKVENGQSTVLAENVMTPPSNVGPTSTPDYPALQAAAVTDVGNGIKTFAGQSDDPFFVELGGLFDLLTIRKLPGNAGGGIDGLKGYNVQSLALQVPINQLTKNKDKPTDVKDPNAVIGVWSTSSRQATKVLTDNGTQNFSGNFVQVSRLGAPLVNEVVIPIKDKDVWNNSKPVNDAQFANYVTDPELGKLLKALYNVSVPPQGEFGSANQRDDLISIFLTGIPNLTKPANVKPSEQLRLNVSVPVSQAPNRLGVLGGDTQGYPNGRRLADDVTDISIQAVAGAAYPLFHPEFTPDPLATQLGDGVNTNDSEFQTKFPYLALPFSGFDSIPHANSAVGGPQSASPSASASAIPSSTASVMPTNSPGASSTPTATPSSTASVMPTNSPGASSTPSTVPSPINEESNSKYDQIIVKFNERLEKAKIKFDKAILEAQSNLKKKLDSGNSNEAKDQFNNTFNQAKDEYNKSTNEAKDSLNDSFNAN
ncbi:MAG: DUF4331 family protein [bacterium]|nr:DUF4331 family protein [bacterium]